MALNIEGGVEAAKNSLISVALPLIIGTFIVALLMGLFRK